MYENYPMKKILENLLEELKPEEKDSPIDILRKNVAYGFTLHLLERVTDYIFIRNFRSRVDGLTEFFHREELNLYEKETVNSVVDRVFNAGFQEGYALRKSEELTQKFFEEPLIRKN